MVFHGLSVASRAKSRGRPAWEPALVQGPPAAPMIAAGLAPLPLGLTGLAPSGRPARTRLEAHRPEAQPRRAAIKMDAVRRVAYESALRESPGTGGAAGTNGAQAGWLADAGTAGRDAALPGSLAWGRPRRPPVDRHRGGAGHAVGGLKHADAHAYEPDGPKLWHRPLRQFK